MACASTIKRHEQGLKAMYLTVRKDLARHIARSALDSDLSQQAWMRRVLASAGPFPVADETGEADQPAIRLADHPGGVDETGEADEPGEV